jgi:hypothetical protein
VSQDDQPAARPDEELPYAVEEWDAQRAGAEKVVARALKISLARALFRAALEENPGRRIVLRHGSRIVEDNGE